MYVACGHRRLSHMCVCVHVWARVFAHGRTPAVLVVRQARPLCLSLCLYILDQRKRPDGLMDGMRTAWACVCLSARCIVSNPQKTYEDALATIAEMGTVVDKLYTRAKRLN